MSSSSSSGGVARRFEDVTPALLESTLAVVQSLGFLSMTPVQAATLPLFLTNKDVCVEAITGSGKTIAYVIPIIEKLLKVDHKWNTGEVGALVLAPTRELARQISTVVSLFTSNTSNPSLVPILLTGGTDVQTDITLCIEKGCHIIIATPGRLLDIMRRDSNVTNITFKYLEMLILDEADTLLDMGFLENINEILSYLPKQRRTGLFSATQTQEVQALVRAGLRNPAIVSVKVKNSNSTSSSSATVPSVSSTSSSTQSTPTTLSNYYTLCQDPLDKLSQLGGFLYERSRMKDKVIIFVLTCASVDYYSKIWNCSSVRALTRLPDTTTFPILPLHGQMDPKKRTGMYNRFLNANSGALLCTDVAARGIDIPDVDWIVQYDPPQDPSFYIHRVGRTARAGRKGAALLYLLPKEASYVQLLGVKNVPIIEQAAIPTNPNDNASTTHTTTLTSSSSSSSSSSATANASYLCVNPDTLGSTLQQEAIQDRDILEKGTKSFVSFIRGYNEHHCKFIFKLDHLNINKLALSYGCVKLPKVDELRNRKDLIKDFQSLSHIDTHTIAYKDPVREAQRQKRLQENEETLRKEREERDARREKALKIQQKMEQQQQLQFANGTTSTTDGPTYAMDHANNRKRKHKGQQTKMYEEWDLLAKEERLEKRLKLGKISKQDYKRELALLHREQGIDGDDDDFIDVAMSRIKDEESDDHPPTRTTTTNKKQKQKKGKTRDDDDENDDDLSDE